MICRGFWERGVKLKDFKQGMIDNYFFLRIFLKSFQCFYLIVIDDVDLSEKFVIRGKSGIDEK